MLIFVRKLLSFMEVFSGGYKMKFVNQIIALAVIKEESLEWVHA